MDEAVIARLALACLLAASACARAQALDDPTRPPAALQAPAGADSAAPAGPVRPLLQSVLLGRGQGGRRVAVIDGQTVRVGEKIHGAVLASVSDTGAVLARGKQREVLKLYPSSVAPAAAVPQR